MHRFFIDQSAISGSTATIKGAEAHHIYNVLRLIQGDKVFLFDGTGNIYTAELTKISKKLVQTKIIATEKQPPANLIPLHLGQALLKGKKMDFLIQKATELGIDTIRPYISDNCTVKKLNENKENRWNRIALEACKQCGRPMPPACHPTTDFDDILTTGNDFDLKLIFWEDENCQSLKKIFTTPIEDIRSAIFLVGPEGGFNDSEISRASSAGYQTVSLGKRILRAETASITAMAILQYLLGNLEQSATPIPPDAYKKEDK